MMASSETVPPSSMALVRKRDEDDEASRQLMPPPPPPKRIKRPRNVIDEDSYTDAISHIIARDFFPGLLESETQKEYLDALESKDEEWISSAGRRLKHIMTPGRHPGRRGTSFSRSQASQGNQTPRGEPASAGDTPMSVSSQQSKAPTATPSESEIDTSMSLTAFQARYTSEDNESFYKLLDRQNAKKAKKYAWLRGAGPSGARLPSKMEIAQKKVENRLLTEGKSLTDDGFSKRDRLAITAKGDEGRGPAQVDTWKAKQPDNALMFQPSEDLLPEGLETRAEAAAAASRAGPRRVDYGNTRFPQPKLFDDNEEEENAENYGDDNDMTSTTTGPSTSAVRDAIAGKRYGPPSTTGGGPGTDVGAGGGETPRVNGYAFVDDEEPELPAWPARKMSRKRYRGTTSSGAPAIDLSVLKAGGDGTPGPFAIREQPKREALHHRMVDRISQSKREARGETNNNNNKVGSSLSSSSTTTPLSRTPRGRKVAASGGLTPAAQRLWSRIGNGRKSNSSTSSTSSNKGIKREMGMTTPVRPSSSSSAGGGGQTPKTPFDHIKSATPRRGGGGAVVVKKEKE